MSDEKDKILSINIEDEMRESYLAYAMSVIVSRALPDVRDGLKPVHRRILYFMSQERLFHNASYKKCAHIVGGVMAKFHPHGDSAIYDSLVRMVQDFSLLMPLIEGQGNFGSVDGDPPAAYRYTEARLQKISNFLLQDIEKNTVDFRPSYDNSHEEPIVLPAAFPNVLVNGSSGVAVGMATNIPPHNLGEVIDGCIAYFNNNDLTLEELLKIVPGPDFPTGAQIIGTLRAKNALAKGQGILTLRSVSHVEEISSNKKALVITEIPYQVNKAKLITDIANLIKEKKIEGITDLRDESDHQGMRIVIELRRDITPEIMLNKLYNTSNLQSSFGVNMLVLLGKKTHVMSILEMIKHFCDFRIQTYTRKTLFLLQKAREKSHILLGLCITLSNIEEIVQLIKTAQDTADARKKLLARSWQVLNVGDLIEILNSDNIKVDTAGYKLTEKQVNAILEMRLQKLTGLEYQKIVSEIKELAQEIQYHHSLLNSRDKMIEQIISELQAIKNEFAIPRRTQIMPDEDFDWKNNVESLLEKEDVVVTVTMNNYIKSVPLNTYKAQSRGGKGRMSQNMYDDDTVIHLFLTTNHNSMLFFSNQGQVYKIKVYKIPIVDTNSRGKALVNFLAMNDDERVSSILTYNADDNAEDNNIIFVTSGGKIRRNDWSDFHNVPSNGKIAMKLDEGENLIGVVSCDNDSDILLSTANGKSIRFTVESLRVFKSRMSSGVKGINLQDDDKVVSICVLKSHHNVDSEMRENYLKIPVNLRIKIAELTKNHDKEDGNNHSQELELIENIPEQERKVINSLSKSENAILQENILEIGQIISLTANEEFLLVCSENGFGKRTSSYEYRLTNRGGVGIINMITSLRNGRVISTFSTSQSDHIILVANDGMILRTAVNKIRIIGRNSQGVKIFNLKKNAKLVSIAKVLEENKEEESEDENNHVS